jgi:hypothetical protein
MSQKPLGRKNYGSIPHLPNSRMGPGDRHCHEGQAKIATKEVRDANDEIIVQEKLDGSNVGIAKIGQQIIPLGRAGYRAETSPYEQHRKFADWVLQPENWKRFNELLNDGERLAGEWLMQAHSTRYDLTHEPFVGFDILRKDRRMSFDEFMDRIEGFGIITPHVVHRGGPISVEKVMNIIGEKGFHGALDPVEGAVWRVERDKPTGRKGEKKRVVDFLVKYVRPNKKDGIYLPNVSGKDAVWNWRPKLG